MRSSTSKTCLRELVYRRAEEHWPALHQELKRCGPRLVSFDWEHVAHYHSLTNFDGLNTPSNLIREALDAMNPVRIANSHRWHQIYENGIHVDSLLWKCQNLACALLDETLAAKIRAHRNELQTLEHFQPIHIDW